MASKVTTKQDVPPKDPSRALETVLIEGDLSVLSPDERIHYYHAVCDSLGLNPLTKPFDYLRLNSRLVLYAKRDATDQLRKVNRISIRLGEPRTIEDVYIVPAHATDASGREDASTGAVYIKGLTGEALANAFLKCETKAKRRVTLSICGLGLLDESEIPVEASARQATRPAPISRKPSDDLADFAGEVAPKQIAEPSPPAHDAETGELVDDGEGRFRIPFDDTDSNTVAAWCSDYKDALMTAENEDDLLAIRAANKDVMLQLSTGGNGGRKAADRLQGIFTSCQIELRRRAAAA